MIFFPPAKINIGLDILRKRPDGYHDISTAMFPVDGLCDILEVAPCEGMDVVFTQSGIPVDCPRDKNLCMKAYELVRDRYGIAGAQIHLHKIIPFSAGLGGGSSDAAYTIKALNRIYRLGMEDGEMEDMAAQLGSDVPFFIGGQAKLAEGRGEILSKVDIDLKGKRIVIIKPAISVSTADAYAAAIPGMPAVPLREKLTADISSWRDNIINAFEPPLFRKYPLLSEIKSELYDAGALYASLSGSGSAIYGIFDNPAHTRASVQPECEKNGDEARLPEKIKKKFGNLFVFQQFI